MGKARRIFTVLASLLAIEGAISLVFMPDIALKVLAIGISITLIYYGARYLLYYITHAQHMVGGKWFLLIGLVLFDMGIFAMTLIDQAKILTLIYIIGSHAVVAVLGMIRAVGNKKDNNPGWKIDLAQGIGAIIQITICIVFIRSDPCLLILRLRGLLRRTHDHPRIQEERDRVRAIRRSYQKANKNITFC